jgi:hypothetical protein
MQHRLYRHLQTPICLMLFAKMIWCIMYGPAVHDGIIEPVLLPGFLAAHQSSASALVRSVLSHLFLPSLSPNTKLVLLIPQRHLTVTNPMAEAFAFAASVAAFVQLADRVISLTKDYLESFKNADASLRAILVQVSTLRGVLESLNFLTQAPGEHSVEIVRRLGAPGGVIELCREAVSNLADLLAEDDGSTSSTVASRDGTSKDGVSKDGASKDGASKDGAIRRKTTELMRRLAWPKKEGRAQKRLEEIRKYCDSIQLALSTQTMCVHITASGVDWAILT